jgi:metacaspase-1
MSPEELPKARADTPPLVSGLRRSGGDLLLAGCKDTEYSYDTRFQGRPNGAFTYYALKTLRERNPANYDAWFNAVREYLPSNRLPQTPQILGTATARRFEILA